METFVQSVVSGALTGSLYAMIGVGLTVVFGVMRIINLAHGEMVMLGMFGAYWGQALWRLDPFLSLVLWAPVMFVAGMGVYRFLLRPVLPGGELNTLLYTAGLSLLVANVALLATEMTTVFGKVKFGNYAGPLGDTYTNQNVFSPEHSVMAQWKDGQLLNVWPKAFAETTLTFPDPIAMK